MKKIFLLLILGTALFASEFSAMNDACDRGISRACYDLGSIFSGEDGLKENPKMAIRYLKKACELDNDKACKKLEQFQNHLITE